MLERFYDTRAEKRVVGHVRNTFGIPMAAVNVQENVYMVITEAVRTELVDAGYTVQEEGEETDRAAPLLSGTLLELSCDAYLSHGGFVKLEVTLTREGQQTFKKIYEGEGNAGASMTSTSAAYAESMSLALQAALRSFIKDLPAALRRRARSEQEQ